MLVVSPCVWLLWRLWGVGLGSHGLSKHTAYFCPKSPKFVSVEITVENPSWSEGQQVTQGVSSADMPQLWNDPLSPPPEPPLYARSTQLTATGVGFCGRFGMIFLWYMAGIARGFTAFLLCFPVSLIKHKCWRYLGHWRCLACATKPLGKGSCKISFRLQPHVLKKNKGNPSIGREHHHRDVFYFCHSFLWTNKTLRTYENLHLLFHHLWAM